jgi:hypothetical protein
VKAPKYSGQASFPIKKNMPERINPILAIDLVATTSIVTLAVLLVRNIIVATIPITKNKYPITLPP